MQRNQVPAMKKSMVKEDLAECLLKMLILSGSSGVECSYIFAEICSTQSTTILPLIQIDGLPSIHPECFKGVGTANSAVKVELH